jgi:hypothetical protein
MPKKKIGPTWRAGGRSGRSTRVGLIRPGWSSSTRREPRDEHDTGPWVGAARLPPDRQGAARPMARADLPRRLCPRRTDRRRAPPRLSRAASGANAEAVRRAIRAVAANLFFLTHSTGPDLNPIEQAFAKLKMLLRKAAERSVDATRAAHRHNPSRPFQNPSGPTMATLLWIWASKVVEAVAAD